jgi:hypothetical protein
VTCLIAYDEARHELNLDPALNGTSPVLDITGTHAPLLTMAFKPSPAVVGQPSRSSARDDEDTATRTPALSSPSARQRVRRRRRRRDGDHERGRRVLLCHQESRHLRGLYLDHDLPGIFPSVYTQDPIAVYGMLFAHPTEP